MLVPVAPGYGANWFCPTNPATEDGWALVLISIDPHTIEAAAGDVRLVACPLVFDPAPVPAAVVAAYTASGATAEISMGALLAKLAESEPIFGSQSL